MKKIISLLLAFSMILPLAACYVSFDEEEFKDAVIDAGEAWVDEKIEEGKEAVSNTTNQAINTVNGYINSAIDTLCFWKTSPDECTHETATQYNKKKMAATCDCGENAFTDLSYDAFLKLDNLPFRWFWQDKEKFYAEEYVIYRGIDPTLAELLGKLQLNVNVANTSEANLDALANTVSTLENALEIDQMYAEFIGDDEVAAMAEVCGGFMGTVGQTIDIAEAVMDFKNMVDNGDDPAVGLESFINLVAAITSDIPYFSTMLEALNSALKMFLKEYEDYQFSIDVTDLGTRESNAVFTEEDWSHFLWRSQWEDDLKKAHIDGAEGTDFLPSLQEAVAALDSVDDDGKALINQYIIFRLDLIFQQSLGIDFQEYVKLVSN